MYKEETNTIHEEAIVTVVRAWYPDICSQEEIKEMVRVWRSVKAVKQTPPGKVEIYIDERGEIAKGGLVKTVRE